MLAVRIFFGAVMLALFVGTNVFLYRRLVRDTTRNRWLRRGAAASMAVAFIATPALRFAFRGSMPPPTIAAVTLSWLGVTIYTLMVLVIVELTRWVMMMRRRAPVEAKGGGPADPPAAIENPERRLFIARATAAGALTFGGGVAAFGAFRAFNPPEVTEVPIKLLGLPKALDGFTIVQLSDIHVGAVIQERFLDQLVGAARSAKPDLVAITGDLVDGTPAQLGSFVARLRNLESRHGTFFVSGNHEYYSGWESWAAKLPGIDFKVLRNERVTIGDAGGSFDLIGVEDWGTRWATNGYDLEKATAGRDPSRASVLLAHQPNGLDLAVAKGIGLQLSGHTHGGQLFPGNLIGTLMWGRRNAGLTREKDTFLYTSRGCGFVGPPMRVGSPPEVVKLVLVAT